MTQSALLLAAALVQVFLPISVAIPNCSQGSATLFDWTDLDYGPFSTYAGFEFFGFTSSSVFSEQTISGNNVSQRCIEGEASQGSSSALSFARDSNQAFDIQSMDMVVSSDIDIDVVYLLENGSVCKNTAACSTNGSTLDNPCGAAQALSFHVSPDSSDSTCGLGILEMVLACPDGAPTSSVLTATVVETATTVASVLASSVASIDVAASSSLDALSSSLISVSLPTASSSNLSTSLGSLTPLYLNSTILVLSGTSAAGSCPAESAATSATGLGMSVLASLMTTSSETFISGGVPAAITSAPGQPVSGTNLSTPSFSGTETVSVPSPAPYVGGAAFHKNRSGAQILAGSWIILLAIDI